MYELIDRITEFSDVIFFFFFFNDFSKTMQHPHLHPIAIVTLPEERSTPRQNSAVFFFVNEVYIYTLLAGRLTHTCSHTMPSQGVPCINGHS